MESPGAAEVNCCDFTRLNTGAVTEIYHGLLGMFPVSVLEKYATFSTVVPGSVERRMPENVKTEKPPG